MICDLNSGENRSLSFPPFYITGGGLPILETPLQVLSVSRICFQGFGLNAEKLYQLSLLEE